jgi:hypothetical protein
MPVLGVPVPLRILLLENGWMNAIRIVIINLDLMEENHFGKYVGETNEY